MKKDEKPDTLAVIDNYNFYNRQTHKQTDGHGDSMTVPAQRPKSVKIVTKMALGLHWDQALVKYPAPYIFCLFCGNACCFISGFC